MVGGIKKLAGRHHETSLLIVDARRCWGGRYHRAGDVTAEREERRCVVTSSRLACNIEGLDRVGRLECIERGIDQPDLPWSHALKLIARRAECSGPGDLNERHLRDLRKAIGIGLHLVRG